MCLSSSCGCMNYDEKSLLFGYGVSYLCEKILSSSLKVSSTLQAEALTTFVLGYLFTDICIANSLGI